MVRENKTECKMTFRNEEPHVSKRFPRVRGDVPHPWVGTPHSGVFSPRARGCSPPPGRDPPTRGVFPACAGVFPVHIMRDPHGESFPRVRGDVPRGIPTSRSSRRFSPRARGCSGVNAFRSLGGGVFPACAGMFRSAALPEKCIQCFPRVRGDVPLSFRFT